MNSSFNACNGNDTKCVQMTPNDEAVLNAIFNPFEPTLIPSSEQFEDADDNNSNAQTPQLPEHLRKQELEAIQLAESDKLEESLIIFNDLIKDYPNCASILNNRAQVLQLMKRLDSALEDLNRAINLCDQNRNRKVLGQSLCQRALIHRLRGEDQQSYQDFTKASQLGNMFARRQLVALNPYAALCNQMLGQMLNNVRQGKQPDA